MMGMAEQKKQFLALYEKANDHLNTRKERVQAWCDWGIASKSVHDMAKALREIQRLNERL